MSIETDELRKRLDRIESDCRSFEAVLAAQSKQLAALKHTLGAFDALIGKDRQIRAKLISRLDHVEKAAAGLLEYFNKLRLVVELHDKRITDLVGGDHAEIQ